MWTTPDVHLQTSQLELLELVRILPRGEVRVSTLYIDLSSFTLLRADEQIRLKAAVANLYVLETTCKPLSLYSDRYFTSSFLDDRS
jgi:hypothetical protein